jgi:hypothetical protein
MQRFKIQPNNSAAVVQAQHTLTIPDLWLWCEEQFGERDPERECQLRKGVNFRPQAWGFGEGPRVVKPTQCSYVGLHFVDRFEWVAFHLTQWVASAQCLADSCRSFRLEHSVLTRHLLDGAYGPTYPTMVVQLIYFLQNQGPLSHAYVAGLRAFFEPTRFIEKEIPGIYLVVSAPWQCFAASQLDRSKSCILIIT